MKLRTRKSDLSGVPIFFASAPCDLQHDAAMAHALVMAWGEAPATHCASYREYDEFLKERADEIMAGWGYTEPEVDSER